MISIVVASLLAGFFYIFLGLLAHVRGQGERPANIFFGLSFSTAGMAFSNAFMYSAANESRARLGHVSGMFFWAFAYPLILWVIYELSTHRRLPSVRTVACILAAALCVVGLAVHPDVGGQVRFIRTDLGWARDLSGLGNWLWFVRLYVLATFVAVFIVLGRWLRRTRMPGERKQAMWLLVTGAVTITVAVVNVTIIMPLHKVPTAPWTPHFVGLIWAFGFVMGMWKFQMMSGMPMMAMTEVLAAIQDAIIFLNPEGVITEASPRIAAMAGISPAAMVGRHIRDVEAFAHLMPMITDGSARCLDETSIINAEGTHIPVNVIASNVLDDSGNPKGTVVIFQDLRATQKLVEAKRQESLAMMSAGIAHDFNNLLTVAGGNIELCQNGIDRTGSARQNAYLNEASCALSLARSLTGQLMTFSRGGDPVRSNTSLDRLIAQSAGLVLAGTNVTMVKESDDDLWPVHVDPVQTSQVFGNILLNAVQSIEGVGTVTIRLMNIPTREDRPDMVRVEISDTGCGIPDAIIDRIFDPFFTSRKGGTGLGLASVKSIVDRHGGLISVRSKVGTGSVFTVDLPRGPAPAQDLTSTEARLAKSAGSVLVMDDIESVRRVATEMLGVAGFNADSVEDGDEAVNAVRERLDAGCPYDVVILDLTVPGGIGGVVALRGIRAVQPGIGAIVSSGYSDGAEMADFRRFGFDAALPKPYTLENLAAAVSVALDAGKRTTVTPTP